MTALLILGIVSLILTVSFGVVITVLVSKALSNAFRALDSQNGRHAQQVDVLLDRLVAIDWEKYAVMQSLKEPEEGGFEVPGETQEEGEVVERTRWGTLSRLRERTDLTADEERLVAEDFPDERSGG